MSDSSDAEWPEPWEGGNPSGKAHERRKEPIYPAFRRQSFPTQMQFLREEMHVGECAESSTEKVDDFQVHGEAEFRPSKELGNYLPGVPVRSNGGERKTLRTCMYPEGEEIATDERLAERGKVECSYLPESENVVKISAPSEVAVGKNEYAAVKDLQSRIRQTFKNNELVKDIENILEDVIEITEIPMTRTNRIMMEGEQAGGKIE